MKRYHYSPEEKEIKKLVDNKLDDLSEFTVGGLNQWTYVYEYLLVKHDRKINQATREMTARLSLNFK